MHFSEHSCCCCSLRGLNIIDYDKRCRRYLSRRAPSVKWALLSLEALATECKVRTDANAVEYDTNPLFRFLRDLPTTLPFEMDTISLLTKLKYLYFKKKLLVVLKDNLFTEYIDLTKKTLKDSLSTCQVVEVIKKVIKVCTVLQPQTELTSEEVHQYEFIADILKLCYEVNVQDSELVISLVKMAIDMHMIELSDSRHVRQPLYPQGFFKYILQQLTKEKFDIESYCNNRPRTLWEYSRHFSVINAVSFGNMDRTVSLLQHGFQVFPESEMRKSGHGFPFIKEVMPRTHRMVLHIMSSMRSINLIIINSTQIYNNELYSVTSDQKECFRLLWRDLQEPYVKHSEMGQSISAEYFHLIRHAVMNPMRYEKNTKFCIMYEMCFMEMASGAKGPRSLKHLSRCTVRKSLRESWSLPSGIFQLGLPKILEHYLNLKSD